METKAFESKVYIQRDFQTSLYIDLIFDNRIDQDKTLTASGAIYNLRQDKPAKEDWFKWIPTFVEDIRFGAINKFV